MKRLVSRTFNYVLISAMVFAFFALSWVNVELFMSMGDVILCGIPVYVVTMIVMQRRYLRSGDYTLEKTRLETIELILYPLMLGLMITLSFINTRIIIIAGLAFLGFILDMNVRNRIYYNDEEIVFYGKVFNRNQCKIEKGGYGIFSYRVSTQDDDVKIPLGEEGLKIMKSLLNQ